MEESIKALTQLIADSSEQFRSFLPMLEEEADHIISTKTTDPKIIEKLLDTLLSLTTAGIGNDLYIKMLDYYKTVDAVAAKEYWDIYK